MDNIHEDWYDFFISNKELLYTIMHAIRDSPFYLFFDDIFNAFRISPKDIKLIFLGQDPYIKLGEAHGLSFSVPKTTKIPPSLKNIFKELNTEYNNKYTFTHGNLTEWMQRENIMLLNSALTVEPGKSNSHKHVWEVFTNNAIKYISNNYSDKVFLLLGNDAIKKQNYIDINKHHIVKGTHPSPLSAHNGFFDSGIFLKIDDILASINKTPINWQN